MRLSIVYENKSDSGTHVYCEFKPDDFKRILLEEFEKIHSVGTLDNTKNEVPRAFERTCERLKEVALRTA